METLQDKLFANWQDWKSFFKVLFNIVFVALISIILWFFPLSLVVAPFYSITTDEVKSIKQYNNLLGKTTVYSVRNGINDLLDEGLVTNFTGVNLYIDNKYYEQVGQIEMYRIAVNTLENNLARNRGTGGANKYLVKARSNIYADYTLPIFTSYTTRLKQTVSNIDSNVMQLQKDKNVGMNKKEAVFIINSDNLAEVLDKLKQQLQTNTMVKSSFFTDDDKFYQLKGNLIAISKFLQGIDYDFKDKMKDKSSYVENFVPLLELVNEAISQNHIVILEALGHVSKLEKQANIIAQKLGELRDKLRNG